jgi:uncharacterized protein YfbU (UPF0304 family)
MAFEPTGIKKVIKGKMVLLYTDTDEHIASFFHEEKCDWVMDALEDYHGVEIAKEKKATAPKKTLKKKVKK